MRREGGSGAKAKARLERRVVLLVVLGRGQRCGHLVVDG